MKKKANTNRSKRKIIWRIVNAFALALLVATFSISGQIIYEYKRYRPFYVSGDSMYPFFNKDATRTNMETGITETSHDGDWGDYDNPAYSYVCDYGLLDDKDGFMGRISRFDIVMAYFDDDYSLSDGALINGYAHAPKIKRLYGFPGESLYFDDKGDLFLKEKSATVYRLFPQDPSIVDDGHIQETSIGARFATKENPVILGEDEYFLVGDNRRMGKSNDCREKGPIGRKHNLDSRYPSGSFFIRGRVAAITGKASIEVKYDEDGRKEIKDRLIYSSLSFPWTIKEL